VFVLFGGGGGFSSLVFGGFLVAGFFFCGLTVWVVGGSVFCWFFVLGVLGGWVFFFFFFLFFFFFFFFFFFPETPLQGNTRSFFSRRAYGSLRQERVLQLSSSTFPSFPPFLLFFKKAVGFLRVGSPFSFLLSSQALLDTALPFKADLSSLVGHWRGSSFGK